MSNKRSARLLRAIANELAQEIMPALESADAKERAGLAKVVLDYLAADLDVLTETAAEHAGGYDVPDRRVRVGMLMQYLKGASLVATSGRNFEEGGTHEFIKGGSSFTGLRMIEARISALLRDLGAVLGKPNEISP